MARLVRVDVGRQRLTLHVDDEVVAEWPVSTASAGVGGEEGSNRTPLGRHRIYRRIGDGADPGTVFVGRVATGEVWGGAPDERDLVLTRVLTLEGLDDGVNRGAGCDSLQRFIYIHGTNHEQALGRPESHGCIRMGNTDVIELFDRVEEGDPVLIEE